MAAYIDKSEEKRYLQDLARTKALFSQMIEQSPIGVVIVNTRTNEAITINKVALNILGKETSDNFNLLDIDKPWKVYDENHKEIEREDLPLLQAMRGITTENKSLIIKRISDGKEFWCEANSGPVYNESKEIIAASLLFNNISADQTVQYKMKMLSKFPKQNPNPVMRITTEGDVVYYNPASDRILANWGFKDGNIDDIKILDNIGRCSKDE
ncbi:MAG: PAS domain-containing protein, partial [Promethearchaeota archaeon]